MRLGAVSEHSSSSRFVDGTGGSFRQLSTDVDIPAFNDLELTAWKEVVDGIAINDLSVNSL